MFDKVLGLGSTDPLTGMIVDWSGMIITAYIDDVNREGEVLQGGGRRGRSSRRGRPSWSPLTRLPQKLDDTHKKVEEMHAILLQAKGARWVIVGLAGVAGLASGLVAKLMPWSGAWPR